jgi:hypothetical protein
VIRILWFLGVTELETSNRKGALLFRSAASDGSRGTAAMSSPTLSVAGRPLLRGRSLCRIRDLRSVLPLVSAVVVSSPWSLAGRPPSLTTNAAPNEVGGGSMLRIDILIAAMLATATSAGGYDLQSPATREKATNECVLDSIKDSDVPLAGLRAYFQCTVEEMAQAANRARTE